MCGEPVAPIRAGASTSAEHGLDATHEVDTLAGGPLGSRSIVEDLHAHPAGVADLVAGREVHGTEPGPLEVRIVGVEVFQLPGARQDDIVNRLRLARHRLDVEMQPHVRRVDPLDEPAGLRGGREHVGLGGRERLEGHHGVGRL